MQHVASTGSLLDNSEIADYIHWFTQHFVSDPKSRGRTFQRRSPLENFRSSAAVDVSMVFGGCPRLEDLEEKFEVGNDWPGMQSLNRGFRIVRGEISDQPARLRNLGVLLTGNLSPAAGTTNVILGLVEEGRKHFQKIVGFLDGPQGLASNAFVDITNVDRKYLNQPGCDLLGFSSLRAIEDRDCEEIANILDSLELDALVFIGGPDEIAHVAQLVEYLNFNLISDCSIISVFQSPNDSVHYPPYIQRTLGFDTAVVTLCELIGNISLFPSLSLVLSGSIVRTLEVARRLRLAHFLLPSDLPDTAEFANHISASISKSGPSLCILVADGVDFNAFKVALSSKGHEFKVMDMNMLARMAFPTISDCNHGFALGLTAGCLAANGKHGTVAFADSTNDFFGGFPLGSILTPRASQSLALGRPNKIPDEFEHRASSPEFRKLQRLKTFREAGVPEISIRRQIVVSADLKALAYPSKEFGLVDHGPYQFGIFNTTGPALIPETVWSRSPGITLAVDFEGCPSEESVIRVSEGRRTYRIIVSGLVGAGTAVAVTTLIERLNARCPQSLIYLWDGSLGSMTWREIDHRVVGNETLKLEYTSALPEIVEISDHFFIFGDSQTLQQSEEKYVGTEFAIFIPCDSANAISWIPRCLGFETTVRVLCGVLGSLSTLAASTKSDWIFVSLEEGSVHLSRLALQCARETTVHAVLVPERFEGKSERKIVDFVANLVLERSAQGSDFGILVITEDMRHKFPGIQSDKRVHEHLKDQVSRELIRRAFLGNTKALFTCRLFELNLALSLASLPHCSDIRLGVLMGAAVADLALTDQQTESKRSLRVLMFENLSMAETFWRPIAVPLVNENGARREFASLPLDDLHDLPEPSQRRFINMGPLQLKSCDVLGGVNPHSHSWSLMELHRVTWAIRVAAHHGSEQARSAATALIASARTLLSSRQANRL